MLEAEGWSVTRLPVTGDGVVEPGAVAAALRPDTTLVSIMYANNEIGTLQPLAEIAALTHAAGALLHTDAVATAGYLDLDPGRLGVDLLSLSAHKFNGPKGVGVLYVRRGTPLVAQIVGGGQEHGLRSGTENLAGVAGLARALELAAAERSATLPRVTALRDRLAAAIARALPGTIELGASAPRAPHILSIGFPNPTLPSDALLAWHSIWEVRFSVGKWKRVCCRVLGAEPRRRCLGCITRVRPRGFAVFSWTIDYRGGRGWRGGGRGPGCRADADRRRVGTGRPGDFRLRGSATSIRHRFGGNLFRRSIGRTLCSVSVRVSAFS